ncbi:MAG: hypothetical protein GY765_20155, partial [bacterium]|nr:hypothetical protein [bacterium]
MKKRFFAFMLIFLTIAGARVFPAQTIAFPELLKPDSFVVNGDRFLIKVFDTH